MLMHADGRLEVVGALSVGHAWAEMHSTSCSRRGMRGSRSGHEVWAGNLNLGMIVGSI
jgi:hypothetical protein